MTKILIKRGQAEANLPTLDPGEPAVTFDSGGKLWIGTPSGNLEITGGGGGSPGAPNGSVQFNDGGSLGGSANFLWSDSDNQLLVGGPTPVSANSVLEAHDSYVNTIFILANDTASAELNTAAMGFYLKNSAEAQRPFAGFEVGSADLTDGSEDGYFTIATMFGGTSTPLFRLDPTAINLNYLGRDTDTIIQGDTATKLGVFDAGLDAFQVGTTVAGAIADFRSTEIVFNDSGDSRDFRVEGDTLTHLLFVDGSADTVGINTATPNSSYKLHVVSTAANSIFERSATGAAGINVFYNPDSTDGNAAVISFATDTTGSGATAQKAGVQLWGITNTHDDATYATEFQIRTRVAGAIGSRFSVTGNVNIDGTTTALVVSRLTTTQQNALTGINGMIIYNTSTSKFRGYAGGAWVDLH